MSSSIYDYLMDHKNKKPISFHIPGHKSSSIYKDFGYDGILTDIFDYDITEITGADNLFDTQGIIKEAQDNYARLLGVKESFFLVNGTSSGILASILTSVKKNHKLIVSRDCHKSVFNALYLGNIEPVFIYPNLLQELGISSGYSCESIEKLILENPDADAVFIQNPNFYGICSDLSSIANLVHRHNMILIVDEAHGAHLGFTNLLPASAASAQADIIVQSVHKTLPSLTQSSVLHVHSSKVDLDQLKFHLQVFQSSSPSYLLLASLDIARDILEKKGTLLLESLMEHLHSFYDKFSNLSHIKILEPSSAFFDLDKTKLNIYIDPPILSGYALDKRLREDYAIYSELTGLTNILAVTSLATSWQDLDQLFKALEHIDSQLSHFTHQLSEKQFEPLLSPTLMKPVRKVSVYDALNHPKKLIDLHQSQGKISAGMIIPYPPGIPLVCPGEEITWEMIVYIEKLLDSHLHVMGVLDKKISIMV